MTEENQCLYNKCKRDLEDIYDNIAEGRRIRSRCQWYEEGQKSSKFCLNLEKFNGPQRQIRKVMVNIQEITDPNKIKNVIRIFMNLFLKRVTQNLPPKSTILLIRFRFVN